MLQGGHGPARRVVLLDVADGCSHESDVRTAPAMDPLDQPRLQPAVYHSIETSDSKDMNYQIGL